MAWPLAEELFLRLPLEPPDLTQVTAEQEQTVHKHDVIGK